MLLKQKKIIQLTIFVTSLVLTSCSSDQNQKDETKLLEGKISELENILNITNADTVTAWHRLDRIKDKIIVELDYEQYPFFAYQSDTVNYGSDYKASLVLAYLHHQKPANAVIDFNNRIDTIPFHANSRTFAIELKPYQKGENKFAGYIFIESDSNRYPFLGYFYAK